MKTPTIALAAAALGWFEPTLAPAASGPEPAAAAQRAESPAGQELAESEGEQERSFRFSTDPEDAVLRADYFTQVGDETAVFTLYGNGRLTHEHGSKATEEVHNRVEMQLDARGGGGSAWSASSSTAACSSAAPTASTPAACPRIRTGGPIRAAQGSN